MERNIERDDPGTTDHEFVVSDPDDEILTDRHGDSGQTRVSGQDGCSQSAGRMPARRSEETD